MGFLSDGCATRMNQHVLGQSFKAAERFGEHAVAEWFLVFVSSPVKFEPDL